MEKSGLCGSPGSWWSPTKEHVLLFKANPVRFDYFNRFISDWRGLSVLDVGCGGGYTCEHLAGLGAFVNGTDILPASLQEARDHARKGNLTIDYRLCTAEKLPFADQAMDCITCFDVLEHIVDKQKTLAEIYRVLKPGGWFFFDTVNQTVLSKWTAIWCGERLLRIIPRGTHDWRLFIGPETLRQLLAARGFSVKEFAGIRFKWRRRTKGSLPVRVVPEGNMSVIYFGAACCSAASISHRKWSD